MNLQVILGQRRRNILQLVDDTPQAVAILALPYQDRIIGGDNNKVVDAKQVTAAPARM